MSRDQRWTYALRGLALLAFLLASLAVLSEPGLQNDELIFSAPLFRSGAGIYSIHAGSLGIPVMLVSYAGALKTWLYAGLFALVAPGVWSVRLPIVLLGAITIWLTWLWVRRIAGIRAAAVAVILLATDTSFILTNTFDWGPVALQHVLMVGALLALQIWLDTSSRRYMLALGCFLFGLGFWEKALMIWPLVGLGTAVLCIWPRELFAKLRPANIAIALTAFLIGSAPLILYNVESRGVTATENVKFSTADLAIKATVLARTIEGDALYGFMIYEPGSRPLREPHKKVGVLADWIARHTGDHRTNQMLPACVFALVGFVVLVLLRFNGARLLAFLLIAMTIEWAQMALTKGAGGAAHHAILLWPFPAVFIGIVFSTLADRTPRFGVQGLTVLVAVLVAGNLLTTNRFLVTAAEYGGEGGWTDAINPLADYLETQRSRWIGLVDWGCETPLELLGRGGLQLFTAYQADRNPDEINGVPNSLFVQHTSDKQMFPDANERFRKAAAASGYTEKIDRVISDRNGRPVFEVFHVERIN